MEARVITYLKVDVRSSSGSATTVMTGIDESGASLLADANLPGSGRISLDIYERVDGTPIEVEAEISSADPVSSEQTLSPGFTVRLPKLEVLFLDLPPKLQALIERLSEARAQERQVVLVDDEPAQLWMVQSLLADLGLESICIYRSLAAGEVIRTAQPSLIVLDLNMPDLDGRGLCRAIKADPLTAHIPVIFLSAQPTEEIREAAESCGADAYLEKGTNIFALVDEVRRFLPPSEQDPP